MKIVCHGPQKGNHDMIQNISLWLYRLLGGTLRLFYNSVYGPEMETQDFIRPQQNPTKEKENPTRIH